LYAQMALVFWQMVRGSEKENEVNTHTVERF
jgi:hypothetical protein